jgi:hypothetical protein
MLDRLAATIQQTSEAEDNVEPTICRLFTTRLIEVYRGSFSFVKG